MKHEWRKHEKKVYLPKNKPEIIDVPRYKFLTIKGEGNPNSDFFAECIMALYSLSYGIKMCPRKGVNPEGYFDYTVYPLEGVWDINDEAKKTFDGTINKDDLVFKLMIRQPDFVNDELVEITEGKCIQMLHLGSYDNEPASFKIMEEFATKSGVKRLSKIHREIYLSDARKVVPEKLKTVLRFQLK